MKRKALKEGAKAMADKKRRELNLSSYARVRDDAPTMEAYRILRTNIEFSGKQKQYKTLLLTSSVMQEGKSTTVSNLGRVFAMAGTKTLIVDLDLRRPVQHRLLAVDNTCGITDVYLGNANLEDTIKPVDIENLYLLNAGKIPPNPAEILASERLKAILNEVKEVFDIILIDSPPVAVLADAAILSSSTDATILVVAVDLVDSDDVKSAVENLNNAGANILGVVMNNVTRSTRGYKHYSYYYRYY